MGTLGIVEEEPIGEFLVEQGEIGEEQILVVIDEGFLQGAVEAFGVGVHFWGLGVGIPALDAVGLAGLGEARFELRAVVGKQHLGLGRQQSQGGLERGLGVAGRLAGDGEGEGQTAGGIDAGDEVAAQTIANALSASHPLQEAVLQITLNDCGIKCLPLTQITKDVTPGVGGWIPDHRR